MNPFLDGPRAVLDLAGIRAWTDANTRARDAYNATQCGSYAGYRHHRTINQDACEDCLAANREHVAKWARDRKTRRSTSSQSPTSGGTP